MEMTCKLVYNQLKHSPFHRLCFLFGPFTRWYHISQNLALVVVITVTITYLEVILHKALYKHHAG